MNKIVYLVIILCLLVGSGSTLLAQTPVQVAQWAVRAEASSQYTDTSWSAANALGAPDVFECADNALAWASATVTEQETLTLYYAQAVQPTQVNIYQTYNPGAIVSIDLIPADGGDPIPVRNSADPGTACPGVFSIDVPEGLPQVNGVIINLDQSLINNWNEIDAVELVGLGVAKSAQLSSLESGEYTMYPVTSNDGTGAISQNTNTFQNFTGAWGVDYTCSDGTQIINGLDLTIVQQRAGNSYTVTVVGLNGFDPVLAVSDQYGNNVCNDDSADAADYGADLPTTGVVALSSTSSQVVFNINSSNDFEDVRLNIGGFAGQGGEFIVIVEGMYASPSDGVGDPFSLNLSPSLLMSLVDPTVYMISVVNGFDPILLLIDGEYNVINDGTGSPVACDDAGNTSLCWGTSADLSNSFVSRSQNRQLAGGTLDSMLTLDIDPTYEPGGFYNFAFAGNQTEGDYVAVFHLGTSQPQQ